MPEAKIAQAVQLLDLMLEHFADDGHWTLGRYDDGNGGHCLNGALLHLSASTANAPVCSPSAAMISPGSETARRTTSRMTSLPRSMRAARQTAAKRSMSNTDILPTFHGVTEAATIAIGRLRLTEGGNTEGLQLNRPQGPGRRRLYIPYPGLIGSLIGDPSSGRGGASDTRLL